MGSRHPPGFYDTDALNAVESAFREVWKVLAMSARLHDMDNDGLRIAVIQRLLGLVGNGITTQDELRTRTLSDFGAEPLRD
jgi:hypothetical protein